MTQSIHHTFYKTMENEIAVLAGIVNDAIHQDFISVAWEDVWDPVSNTTRQIVDDIGAL